MKILLTILLLLNINAFGQQQFDTISISAPCWCGMHRYDEDTSKWMLYKIIEKGRVKEYNYFSIVFFGMVGSDGWSDLIAYSEKLYSKKYHLLPHCKEKDTIPQVQHFSAYDKEKKSFKYWDEYWVGGLFGEKIRTGITYYEKK